MRICTWNLGLYTWMKHAPLFNLCINQHPIKSEYFCTENTEFIANTLKEIRADIVVLQEFYNPQDFKILNSSLDYENHILLNAWYHSHTIAVLSHDNIKIVEEKSGFTLLEIGKYFVVPIHLHSFSPIKRLAQVQDLLSLTKGRENVVTAGDTNLWTRKNHFFSPTDKKTYGLLTRNFTDHSRDLLTTPLGLSMDKIFSSTHSTSHAKVIKQNAKYMDHYPVCLDF